MNQKNPLLAFFLAFIPGIGHHYLNRKFRGIMYEIGVFGAIIFSLFLFATGSYSAEGFIIIGLVIAFGIWVISMIDMIITLLRYQSQRVETPAVDGESIQKNQPILENDRFHTILLSFIPGLGHFQLGLMNRGLTFLISFFGLGTIIFFLTVITHQGGFIAFLGILPIIWIYCIFDTVQLLNRKQAGEQLVDRTILEDFEETRSNGGKKSKALATILSIFPGAGHLYLGLQKRGIQLMAGFLLAIYILDVLRLSLFLFLIPLIWFFSFFDALQKVSKQEDESLEDIPIISYLINHQKWLGISLLVLGFYYLFDSVMLPVVGEKLREIFQIDVYYLYHQFFQTTVVCFLLIGGGFKLVVGSKRKQKGDEVK